MRLKVKLVVGLIYSSIFVAITLVIYATTLTLVENSKSQNEELYPRPKLNLKSNESNSNSKSENSVLYKSQFLRRFDHSSFFNKTSKMDAKLLPYISKLSKILEVNPVLPRLTKVLNHLFIGSEADATNMRRLRDQGITHVVNCAESYVQTGPEYYTKFGDKIQYLGIRAEDDVNYNMMQHFDDVYSFIENARKSGGKALVHCIMGVNRSGAMTVAYTMVHKDIGPLSAAKLVKDKRRAMLLTNAGFQAQLIQFASDRGYLEKDKSQIARM